MSQPYQVLIEHLTDHSVFKDGPYKLRSGGESSWYIDVRKTAFSGRGAQLIGEAIFSRFPAIEVDAVGGMTMGADPVAVATAYYAAIRGHSLRAFSVRKQEKEHGKGGRLAGPVSEGDRVVIVEDTTTTGSAIWEAIEVVKEAGMKIVSVIVLVDRSQGVVAKQMKEQGFEYHALVKPADLGVE